MNEPYTNLDLDTAEALLRAAGKAELAEALNYHANGVRNLVQGVWGSSFVNSLEMLLVKHIQPLSNGQDTLLAAQEETARGLKKLLDEFIIVINRIERLETQQTHIIDTQSTTSEQVADLSDRLIEFSKVFDIRSARFARFEQMLEEIKRQTLVDTLTREDRIALANVNRRVSELLPELEIIIEEHRSRTRHGE